MQTSDLRIALFSGNYNMTVDGANKALNRLVGYLLKQGAQVRVYSPTIADPDFEPTGDLVSVPSIPIPGRSEYRLPLRFSARVRKDIEAFNPNILHISSPDRASRQAAAWARRRVKRHLQQQPTLKRCILPVFLLMVRPQCARRM